MFYFYSTILFAFEFCWQNFTHTFTPPQFGRTSLQVSSVLHSNSALPHEKVSPSASTRDFPSLPESCRFPLLLPFCWKKVGGAIKTRVFKSSPHAKFSVEIKMLREKLRSHYSVKIYRAQMFKLVKALPYKFHSLILLFISPHKVLFALGMKTDENIFLLQINRPKRGFLLLLASPFSLKK